MCRVELTSLDEREGDHAIIGHECHIRAQSAGGPRFDAKTPPEKVDDYSNLILLCANHHKLVDDQPARYSTEELLTLKGKHEAWVRQRLSTKGGVSSKEAEELGLLVDGWTLLNIIGGAFAFEFDHSQPKTPDETEILASFMDLLQDYGDLYGDLTAGQRLQAGETVHNELEAMSAMGWVLFGGTVHRTLQVADQTAPWPVAVIRFIDLDQIGDESKQDQ